MKPEVAKIVETELKQLVSDLNLSDAQKAQFRTALENAREKMDEIRERNPDITGTDVIGKLVAVRGAVRDRVVSILTPEQLAKWDAGVAKGRTFLGHKLSA